MLYKHSFRRGWCVCVCVAYESMCICMCLCVCVNVCYMYMCVHVCIVCAWICRCPCLYACIQREPEESVYLSLLLYTLFTRDRLPLDQTFSFLADWPMSFQDPSVSLALLTTPITGASAAMSCFLQECCGFEIGSSCSQNKLFEPSTWTLKSLSE